MRPAAHSRFAPALVLAAVVAACAPQSVTQAPAPRASWTDSVLSRMTLREKAAQMVWPSVLGGYQADDSREWALRHAWLDEKVGGFTVSLGSPIDIAVLTNRLQSLSALPLLFGADFEFGAGYRARGGNVGGIDLGSAVIFPPEMALGAANDTALAYAQGRVTAIEGRAIGVHVAYAPILDVNINPKNPVINTRSYGGDPALVSRLGAAFIRGVQDNGMIATGKHFPGHGDTEVNSHLGLPSINVPRARLDSVELPPFRAAVQAGTQAIMSFHGAMPALDSSGVPGTLSRNVLTGLLRGELHFHGLVFSDAMDMRGVLDTYGAEEATIRAVDAGADILLQPLDVKQTIDAIVAGVQRGRYDEARLDRSVRAILAAKERLGLATRRLVALDSVRAVVGTAEHLAAARAAAEQSITLAKDSLNQVPLSLSRTARVLSVTFAPRTDLAAGTAFNAELRARYPAARAEFVDAGAPEREAAFRRLVAVADSVDAIVVSSYVAHAWNVATIAAPESFPGFIDALAATRKPLVLVALGNPYLLQQVPGAPAYLIAWGGFPVSQAAAARALTGAIPIRGRMPVSIPPLVPIGAGIQRDAVANTP